MLSGWRKVGWVSISAKASRVSRHTAELWYNEAVCLWMTIYMYRGHSINEVDFAWGIGNRKYCFHLHFFKETNGDGSITCPKRLSAWPLLTATPGTFYLRVSSPWTLSTLARSCKSLLSPLENIFSNKTFFSVHIIWFALVSHQNLVTGVDGYIFCVV